MTDEYGWARPGSGELPPGWSQNQPPPYQAGNPVPPTAQSPQQWGQPPGGQPFGPYPGWRPAPKPGIVPLRPLGLGELLDGAFTGIRRNPKATLGLAAIVMTIAGVVQAIVSYRLVGQVQSLSTVPGGEPTTGDLKSFAGNTAIWMGISLVVSLIVTALLSGMLSSLYGRAVLGHTTSMGDAWRTVRPRLAAVVGVTVVTVLIDFAVVAVAVAIPVSLGVAGAGAAVVAVVAVVLGLACVCALVFFFVTLALCTPVVVLEHAGVGTALRRSFRLSVRAFWRTLGILLLTRIIAGLVAGILELPFGIVQAVVGGLHPSPGLRLVAVIISTIGGIVGSTFAQPFLAGAIALLYVDLRMRREGFDLALQSVSGSDAGREPPSGEEFARLWRPDGGGSFATQPAGPAYPTPPENPPPS